MRDDELARLYRGRTPEQRAHLQRHAEYAARRRRPAAEVWDQVWLTVGVVALTLLGLAAYRWGP